ncbi:MAG TPA: SAM-dependent methyltransferase, partial [Porphyromonadaceae bacterium]|nr:SAM-dependent methyltransferase [Porphyromonadaceae bacterium]HBK94626.1 SAM-dependent methyltransferase [Porphyromonadaceae bacterium]HBQ55813.1 SAM-dependent methyltransferase [Porphyromonadaceae bacterium]HBU45862.1 SAM-dependent methyltransferase [Porphyromonadaceae bacterium]HCA99679.1 SAM-dependent methyltransferase [Porphyromonadaceae bacterium]
DEYIATRPVKAWKGNLPDMHKKPCVFLIYR